ncbi:hypothetical protein L6164_001641 [Bauhinia variegata]|uniref:Uncharacterized protein n=1 Tax=Bauhinia variegata TaxID=167791 RepID=A0ACB9QAE2_BAUVA|nr:hypothetical protein L6164_001641 [Bauhinia variegata]
MQDAIARKFDYKTLSANPIRIADLGCSTGPNTFIAMQYITEAIELQYHSQGLRTPEFHVFFNDLVSNDFNTLFRNLPCDRIYFVAGVPGSFHGRLFPSKTLHFVHSSSSLNWISRVPGEIEDSDSVAYNKGRIHYGNAPKEVVDAYATQYQKDMKAFLNARAQELVAHGLMMLQIPVAADRIKDSDTAHSKMFELLGSCFMDMAKEGIFCEQKVDSFNLPIFHSTLKDVEEVLESNGDFSIKEKEIVYPQNLPIAPDVGMLVSHVRAGLEGLIEKHFGGGIVDELFQRFAQKVEEFPNIMNVQKLKMAVLFVLLKRMPYV